jgi:CPA1 family monovalent cation:H+ antiporter
MELSVGFIVLFAVATAVAVAARRLRVPYTVALVVTGLALGAAHVMELPHLTKDLLYAAILPGLLFEAAFHLDFEKFWKNKLAILSLAIPGLVVAIILIAAILTPVADALHFVTDFGFVHGLVFAALIAATDPIAVVGLFKSLGAPKRLAVLVEGESLFNDGTAVVVFTLIVGVAAGGDFTVGSAVLDFVRIFGMGALIGGVIGFAVSEILRRLDDPMIEITLTVIAAYGSFVAAEHFHFSGVIATVVAGMLCGNYGARTGMRPSTRIAVESFWEYVVFALNSIVFLLIGLEVSIESILASWKAILVATFAVMLARGLVTAAVTIALRRTREKISWPWSGVIWWAGLRGALSMVLVLGLSVDFPHRVLLLNMTFGVVVISILVQGLSMSPLMRRLGLVGAAPDRHPYELERGRLMAATAALREVDELTSEGVTHSDIVNRLRETYRQRADAAEQAIRDMHADKAELREEEEHIARRLLLVAEKAAVVKAAHEGFVGEEVYAELAEEIDGRLTELEQQDEISDPPDEPGA